MGNSTINMAETPTVGGKSHDQEKLAETPKFGGKSNDQI